MTDREAYRKLYGDLVYCVEKYYPGPRKLSEQEILIGQMMAQHKYSQDISLLQQLGRPIGGLG